MCEQEIMCNSENEIRKVLLKFNSVCGIFVFIAFKRNVPTLLLLCRAKYTMFFLFIRKLIEFGRMRYNVETKIQKQQCM